MKTQLLFIVYSLFFTLLSCNKKNDITPTSVPQDYLVKYLGTYTCNAHYSSYAGSQYDSYSNKTIHIYKAYDSAIVIYGSGLMKDTVEAKFFSDTSFIGGAPFPYSYRGYFKNDSVFYSQAVGSAGSYAYWDLKGKKQ